jgi:hypothetical protein
MSPIDVGVDDAGGVKPGVQFEDFGAVFSIREVEGREGVSR